MNETLKNRLETVIKDYEFNYPDYVTELLKGIVNNQKYDTKKWHELEEFYNPNDARSWVLPNSKTIFAVYAALADSIKTDSLKLTLANFQTDYQKWALSILVQNRSKVWKGKQLPEVSGAVPGILYIHKKYNGVPYNAWNLENPDNADYLEQCMPAGIAATLRQFYHKSHNFTPEFLRSVEPRGYGVKPTGNEEFDKLPAMYKMLLSRNWMWEFDSPYLIYDMMDLDKLPREYRVGRIPIKDSDDL